MLQRTRELLTVIFLSALPFHALFVTVTTLVLVGPNHAPLSVLALWKETLLAAILIIALMEIAGDIKKAFRVDYLDAWIFVLGVLMLVVSFFTHGNIGLIALGVKYDLLPLGAFLILRRVDWSDAWKATVIRALIVVGCVVAGYGILSFVLPASFFHVLGYSDLHSLYQPQGPLAAFQQIGGLGLRRIQSTVSGPNQLGLWLLLPLGVALSVLLHPHKKHASIVTFVANFFHRKTARKHRMAIPAAVLIVLALILTFSRAAWIGAVVVTLVVLFVSLSKKTLHQVLFHMLWFGTLILITVTFVAPSVIVRGASTRDHLLRPLHAVQTMAQHPFGLGLGMAGPASNRVSDACVFLEDGSDTSWAKAHPQLCVFIDGDQVQPYGRECMCPSLPENWYLQIGLEAGFAGMLIFMAIVTLVLIRIRRGLSVLDTAVLSAFVGISIAALVLHAWEDSAVAYSVWLLLASVLRRE